MTGASADIADETGADVRLTVVGEWSLPGPAEQEATAAAAVHAWRPLPWPDGLLTYSCLLGTDGHTVVHRSGWTGEQASRAFAATDRSRWLGAVDAAVPGIHHRRATAYRPYRSRRASPGGTPGCVVLVTRRFDGPDPDRARRWVDAIFAVPAGARPLPGLIAAHFHVSTDGSRVLNYAEWTTEEAHRAATAGAPRRIRDDPHMRRVDSWPGLESTTVQRFRTYRTLVRPLP